MINILLRPVLAITCGLSLCYDLALMAWQKRQRLDGQSIVERRAARRGLLDTESGFAVLQDLNAAAEATGARVFLVSGTLLGLHREGQLLKHDYDMDVGIFDDDPALPAFLAAMAAMPGLQRSSATKLSATDCLLNPWLGLSPEKPILHKFFFRNDRGKGEHFGVDVFVHFRANGFDVHGSYRCMWVNTAMQFEKRNFGGATFLAPVDTHTYLTENYGNYTAENRNFESSVDCPNTTNIYGFRSVMWLTGRYAYFLASHQPHKRRVIGRRLWDYVRYGLFLQGTPRWHMHQYEDRT